MDAVTVGTHRVDIERAWTSAEVRQAVEDLLVARQDAFPEDLGAHIVLKPNLNNDLVALTGNSVDLRVLCAVLEVLRGWGYTRITVADGSNVGVERRGIDTFKRLRVEALQRRYGVQILDLNRQSGTRVHLHAGAMPEVADLIFSADFLISIPKIKTHAEAGMSIACKNWVGITRGQDKRHMHYDLARNIAAINEVIRPDLVLVDGLVGMEGNGPGDGDPYRLGLLVCAEDTWANDLVCCRLVGFPWRDVGYLRHGLEAGHFTAEDADALQRLEVVRPVQPAPRRTKLAELSEKRWLEWLKKAVRPVVSRPEVAELAYKARIIQDVYSLEDDAVTAVQRTATLESCEGCRRCEEVCPTRLPLAQIGVAHDEPDCITCLYCWWVCPEDALTLQGELNAMERQVQRYKSTIEQL